ncbi:MAG: tetratricopeptide repeat protein, partial [Chloroflexota bacterium]
VALGQHFKGMEHFFAREETPLETCLDAVARSHWLVLVVGQRYGAIDERGISYTEREYLRAGELKIPRFVFLQDESVTDAPRDDEPAKRESVKRFRADLMARHTVAFFKNPDELAKQVALTLAREISIRVTASRGLMPHAPPEIFVGRDDELRDIAARLSANGAVGIAGVRGLGGIGKSALATVFAYAHIAEYPDGLLWVTLAGRDPMLLLSDLANVFGEDVSRYADVAGRAARVRALLDGKRALLILDDARKEDLPNLPHLQMRCPTLITTRLESLAIVPPRAMLSLEILSEDDALALCREVLSDSRSVGDRVDDARDDYIALCNAVGRLPLALNILLRRLFTDKALNVEELTQRVADRKRAIKEVSKSDDPNLNVRASFDLSYAALGEWDQKLFRALGVFDAPDFSAEMLVVILSGAKNPVAAETRFFGAILRLRDKNRRSAQDAPQNDMADDVRDGLDNLAQYCLLARAERGRFHLHPLLHSYAQNLLSEAGEEARLREQAASAYLEFTQSHSEPDGWDELELERENIFGALEWCHSHQQDRTLIGIVDSLDEFARTRGYWEQSIVWSKYEHESGERLGDKLVQANAMLGMAMILTRHGNHAQARELLQQSRTFFTEIENRLGEASVLWELGYIESEQGNYLEARAFFGQSLAMREESGDKRGIVATLHELGRVEFRQGDLATARMYYERSLALEKDLGYKLEMAATLHDLGAIETQQGNYAPAQMFYEQAMALDEELGNKEGMAGTLQTVGVLELREGKLIQAERNFREGLKIAQQIGDNYWIASHQYALAKVEARKGNRASAVELARAALALWEELRAPEAEWARKLLGELGEEALPGD